MSLDPKQIKERISLVELFERDGHQLKKMGHTYMVRCPFHEEKTASCHVHEEEGYFKCFGCDAKGDVFAYWQRSRGCEFAEALKALAVIAGLGGNGAPEAGRNARPTIGPRAEPKEELAPAMSEEHAATWAKAVERLQKDAVAQERIAQWRGYDVRTVRWAAEKELMGVLPYYEQLREAFLVERQNFWRSTSSASDGSVDKGTMAATVEEGTAPKPVEVNAGANVGRLNSGDHKSGVTAGDTARISVGYHVRLGPRTRGNDTAKPSWRFVPAGIGSWPFVAGQVETAKMVFILEGQWDAMALIDALFVRRDGGQRNGGDAQCESRTASTSNGAVTSDPEAAPGAEFIDLPSTVAVVGMRGATSWKRFLQYSWDPEATIFLIGQADTAGAKWLEEDGLVDQLRQRSDRVWNFFPDIPGKDFNDLWKGKLIDRDQLAGLLKEKLNERGRGRPKLGLTFLQFCKANKKREDEVGTIARAIVADTRRPGGRKPLRVWEQQFLQRYLPEEQHQAFYHAWREYSGAGVAEKAA